LFLARRRRVGKTAPARASTVDRRGERSRRSPTACSSSPSSDAFPVPLQNQTNPHRPQTGRSRDTQGAAKPRQKERLLLFAAAAAVVVPRSKKLKGANSNAAKMMIKVKTLTGKTLELDIEPNDKVERIKERIEQVEGAGDA
jgi:hypothetical protein